MVDVTFAVPDLLIRPIVGGSCCLTTAEAVITQELWMLGGVEDSRVDAEKGRVWARFDPDVTSAEALSAALAEIGYPATPSRAD